MSLLGTSSYNTLLDNPRMMGARFLLPWIINTGATLHATGTLDRTTRIAFGASEWRGGLYYQQVWRGSWWLRVGSATGNCDMFASHSRHCVFVGYPSDTKWWKLFDVQAREYFVSRYVVFYEKEFPFEGIDYDGKVL
ncbi:hypothetical protein LIER_29754 [Lithospermum erythrorhizon]|uniref:Retroviral polymerase SH3-like domain-containing protein n=1 Tax=Lithospermum erythrorhizon TaxID=34254 RepID=A0AAV3RLR9_LITER